jgi:hypothetical protein
MKTPNNGKMSKSERVELGQLIRKRERVMKSYAAERAAQMLAEFDKQSAQLYAFDQDEVWKKSAEEAKRVVEEANKAIAERCKELGIPEEFAPSLDFGWQERGQNAVASRRGELRRMAVSKIKAIEAETLTKIERLSLLAQTEVIANGLESAAAREFLEKMPSLDTLMPSLDVAEIKRLQDERHDEHRLRY